jgi:GTP pyrophosphokinase
MNANAPIDAASTGSLTEMTEGDAGLRSRDKRVLREVLREVVFLARGVDPGAEIAGRIKDLQTTPQERRPSRGRVLDTIGVRVIVQEPAQCYRVMERIHARFGSIPSSYDDYIQHPKENGYQSLHTTILMSSVYPVEVQVRTREMHARADRGAAAHGVYKRRSRLSTT